MTSASSALRMHKIAKVFPGVKALTDVSLTAGYGRVHAIVGENGAGKSTLMKILGGIYAPTSGTIEVDGVAVRMRKPVDSQRLGIRMVHQELNLVSDLSVAENIFLGRMPRKRFMVDRVAMRRDAASVLTELGSDIAPGARLGDLSISQQQLVEIAKAYAANPRMIVLDEPTSSLSEHETAALFRILHKMKQTGIAIIYISHRLREVLEIADDVTVLRDGHVIATRPVEGLGAAEMIRLMVGREVTNVFPKAAAVLGDTVLRVSGLSDGANFYNISFEVRAGEILGLTGLVGAGRTEVAKAIFGLAPLTAGGIEVDGKAVVIRSPAAAMMAGIAYVPEDRKGEGIIPSMSVRENISLPILKRLSQFGRIRRRADRALAAKYASDFQIAPPDPERQINLLSGGNQQKAVISKWLSTGPKVLILDEPTRGVDVGAKAEIHRIVGELVAEGMAVVMISSELPEVLGVCDRVIVMREGRAAPPILRAALTEEGIMTLATAGGAE